MARAEPRPFLDINVIYSVLYTDRGAPARLIDLHFSGQLTIVVSSQVIEELIRNIRVKQPGLTARMYEFLSGTPPLLSPDPALSEIERAAACMNRVDAAI